MLLVSIVHAKDGGVPEYVHNNAPIAIESGDKVVCDTKFASLTSAIREGDDLHITIDRVINYGFSNFFTKEAVTLSFEDVQLDQTAIKDLFVISMIIRHADQVDRQLEATPNSVVDARGGDHFEIFEGNASIHDFRRIDKNMIVTFKHPTKNIESIFTLRGFFAEIASGQERPVIVLADRNHKPIDIFLQPNRDLIEWEGEIPTIMTSGVLYSFIFSLIGVDYSKVQVEAVLDGKPLPGWLSLTQLSISKYMLHGMPPKEFQGKPNIEIIIHQQGDGVNFHSQQSFNLSVFRSEFYERSIATWIVQAEIRGAVSSNVSEAFAVSSSMSASFTPMLVVASVSSLSALSVLGKPMMIDPNFGSFNFTNGLFQLNLNEGIKVDIAPEVVGGEKESGQFGGELSGTGSYNIVTQIGSNDIKIETAQEAIPLSPAAFQLTAASLLNAGMTNLNTNTLSGEFALVGDRVEVLEDSPLIVFKPGLLLNDINTQNPDFFFVVQVNNTVLNLRGLTPVVLPSGAIVFAGINGQFVYDPHGKFEYLNVGQTATDEFTYVATNTLQFAHVIVTVTINGQNDAPIAFNDAFSTLEDPILPMNVFSNHGSGADFDIDNGSSFTVARVAGTTDVGTPVLLPSGALVTLNADGTGTFNPNGVYDHLAQGVVVVDRFTYSIIDENGALSVSPATVTITITGVNDKPVTQDDNFTIDEDHDVIGKNVFNDNGNGKDFDVDDGAVINVHEVNGVIANVGHVITLASGALLTVNSNGTFIYDTNNRFESLNVGETATDQFFYRIHDQFGAVSGPPAAIVTITITGVNDAPVAKADTFNTNEDTPIGGNVFANNGNGADFDVDHGSSFTAALINGSPVHVGSTFALDSGALLTLNADGTFNYDPNGVYNHLAQGASAVDSFNYTIVDENHEQSIAPATVTINITGVNDAPFTTNDSFTINENGTLGPSAARNVLNNDGDVDDAHVIMVNDVNGVVSAVDHVVTLPSGALLTLNSNGTFTYNTNGKFDYLNIGETATDQFHYRIHDEHGAFSSPDGLVTITITGVNDHPVAMADTFTIDQNTPISGNVFADNGSGVDFDVDHGSSFTVALINGSPVHVGSAFALDSGALLTLNADGTFNYDPSGVYLHLAQGASAVDSFTYKIVDENHDQSIAPATVTININGLNDAPFTHDDSFTVSEDNILVASPSRNITDNDVDDGHVVTVYDVNDVTTNVGQEISLSSGALLTLNSDGTFIYKTNGQFDYLNVGETATDHFNYRIQDEHGAISSPDAVVTITITGRNDAPVAKDDAIFTDEKTTVTGNVLFDNGHGADIDVDHASSFTVALINGLPVTFGVPLGLVSHALLTINADGTFSYNPNGAFDHLAQGANATDSFQYTIIDNNLAQSVTPATVTINIAGVNDPPVAVDDAIFTDENTIVSGNVLVNNGHGADFDVDTGANISVAMVNGGIVSFGTPFELPSHAFLTINENGDFNYNPADAYNYLALDERGSDSFNYTIVDEHLAQSVTSATVTININGVNDAPIAYDDPFLTDEKTPVTGNLFEWHGLGADVDVDTGAIISVALVNGASVTFGTPFELPTHALLTINANGDFTYNSAGVYDYLAQGQSGIDSFNYTIVDEHGAQSVSPALVTFSIAGVSDAPVVDLNGAIAGFENVVSFSTSPVNISTDGTLADVDSANLQSMTVVISNPLDGLNESLSASSIGAISVLYNPSTFTLTLSGVDTLANYESVLQSIQYNNIGVTDLSDRLITVQSVDDVGAVSNVVTTTVALTLPMQAMGNPIENSTASQINLDDIYGTIHAAVEVWTINGGLNADQISLLNQIQYHVTDLPGSELGAGSASNIFIDANAAGYGWFVDSTPLDNSEFGVQQGNILQAYDSTAAQHFDILTVLMHEMGHALGVNDLPGSVNEGLMSEQLTLGTRLLPNEATLNFTLLSPQADGQELKFDGDNIIADLRGQNLFHDLNTIDLHGLTSNLGNSVILDSNTVMNVSDNSHTLTLIGDQNDSVLLPANDQWIMSSQLHNGYYIYTSNDAALYVDTHLQVNVI